METFYESGSIPVHSCMMLGDAESARAFPRRDLVLGFCPTCGFVSNVAFDPSVQAYACGYEEQQAFSPRFRKFQSELIAGLIERYDLHGKDVVEIGCGKGDFLIELCNRGGNRGIGIDPACDPERMKNQVGDRVRFIQESYSPRHADWPCDFLCCRHTLEHIQPTQEFIRLMRSVVGDRTDMVVFFEVPAVERVLTECAFWDIYYEHCSYFSLGSLARVFRANRFEVVELHSDYDDQYLLIVARPTDQPTPASFPAEDDIDQLAADVKHFGRQVRQAIDVWKSRIADWRASGKRMAIWGSGSKCVSFLSAVGAPDAIEAVVDINPFRHGKWLAGSGKEVVSPESLPSSPPNVVLVMNPIYTEEIRRELQRLRIIAEVVPV